MLHFVSLVVLQMIAFCFYLFLFTCIYIYIYWIVNQWQNKILLHVISRLHLCVCRAFSILLWQSVYWILCPRVSLCQIRPSCVLICSPSSHFPTCVFKPCVFLVLCWFVCFSSCVSPSRCSCLRPLIPCPVFCLPACFSCTFQV